MRLHQTQHITANMVRHRPVTSSRTCTEGSGRSLGLLLDVVLSAHDLVLLLLKLAVKLPATSTQHKQPERSQFVDARSVSRARNASLGSLECAIEVGNGVGCVGALQLKQQVVHLTIARTYLRYSSAWRTRRRLSCLVGEDLVLLRQILHLPVRHHNPLLAAHVTQPGHLASQIEAGQSYRSATSLLSSSMRSLADC